MQQPNQLNTIAKEILIKSKEWRLNHLYKIVDEFSHLITFQANTPQQHYQKHKHTRNVILKSRRLGFTTFSVIDMLDNTLFNKNYNSLFISYDDSSSQKVFDEMVMLAWNHFPLKDLYNINTENAKQLKLDWGDKTYSTIEVKSSARGGRSNQIHISELGKISKKFPDKAKEIFTGTIQSLTPNGQLTIESTAEGSEGEFYNLFWDSYNKHTSYETHPPKSHEYKAHFYNWQWDTPRISLIKNYPDPGLPQIFLDYQQKHNEKAKHQPTIYQSITDQQITFWYYEYIKLNKRWERLLQEMPTTPEEAFVSSGSKLFDQIKVEELNKYITPPISIINSWTIYEDPKSSHTYILAADPSEGVQRDDSAAIILDITPKKPKLVATYKNNFIAPDIFAYEIKNYAQAYNYALAMVERNNSGHATLSQLKQIYPPEFIYKEEKDTKEETIQTPTLGFRTTQITKPKMFYNLSTAINEDQLDIPSEALISEMRFYDRSELSETTPNPDASNHFDLLTALAISLQGIASFSTLSSPVFTTNIHDQYNNHQSNQPNQLTPVSNLNQQSTYFDKFAAI